MESLTHRGLVKRTKLMTSDRAWRFATCLMANRRFQDVAMVHSSKATGERRYFVQFIPSNPERQQDMKNRQEGSRAVRAWNEGSDYIWVPDKNGGRAFYWLLSASGEVYEVEPHSGVCSCPDYQFRCAGAGIKCKHLLALDLGLGTIERFQPFPAAAPAPTVEERKAAARADIDAVFGK